MPGDTDMEGNSPKNYYSVAIGKQPGIYTTWGKCHKQTNRVSGCLFAGFEHISEAVTFMKTNTFLTDSDISVFDDRGKATSLDNFVKMNNQTHVEQAVVKSTADTHHAHQNQAVRPKKQINCCTKGCAFENVDGGDEMIRCCLCVEWFHITCVELNAEEMAGIWTCEVCRNINQNVMNVHENVVKLIDFVCGLTETVKTLERSNEKTIKLLHDTTCELAKCSEENANLRSTVSELTQTFASKCWSECTKENPPKTLLIGSSVIRDLSETKLIDTEVICKRGGRIHDIKTSLEDIKDESKYDQVIVVVGGNDCSKKSASSASEIVEEYKEMLVSAKKVGEKVTVSSICPRVAETEVQDRIAAVNAGLNVVCDDLPNHTFVDNTSSFFLQDGSINDGYLLKDGLHLTRQATNRLAKNLRLRIAADSGDAHEDHRRSENKVKQAPEPQQEAVTDDSPQSSWKTLTRRKPTPHHQDKPESYKRSKWPRNDTHTTEMQYGSTTNARCYNCYETNHVYRNCKWDKPVICIQCGGEGHKEKHHRYHSY